MREIPAASAKGSSCIKAKQMIKTRLPSLAEDQKSFKMFEMKMELFDFNFSLA